MPAALIRACRIACRLTALGLVLLWAAARQLSPRNRRNPASRARWLQSTCRAALRALGVRWTALGRVPTGMIIAPNHASYLDILALGAITPVVFLAKREVSNWPVFGWFARMAGTQFIHRDKREDVVRAASEFEQTLADGLGLVLFLEGTSTDGDQVRPFKSALLEPAVRAGWPVAPAALVYTAPPGYSVAREVCWWGDMTLTPHLFNLAGLPRVSVCVGWGAPVAGCTDRKTLAAVLHERVTKLHAALHHSITARPDRQTATLIPAVAAGQPSP